MKRAYIAALTRQATETVVPARIGECPIQMEAVVESMTSVEDEAEGFAMVVARINLVHTHNDIPTLDGSTIDPEKPTP